MGPSDRLRQQYYSIYKGVGSIAAGGGEQSAPCPKKA